MILLERNGGIWYKEASGYEVTTQLLKSILKMEIRSKTWKICDEILEWNVSMWTSNDDGS